LKPEAESGSDQNDEICLPGLCWDPEQRWKVSVSASPWSPADCALNRTFDRWANVDRSLSITSQQMVSYSSDQRTWSSQSVRACVVVSLRPLITHYRSLRTPT